MYLGSALLALKLVGCASFQREYPVSNLRVDHTSSKTYVGPEDVAIQRMMDAALTSPDEDAWMEVHEPNGRTYFVDIGKDAGTYMMQFRDSKTNKVVVEIPRKRIEPDREKMWNTILGLPPGSKVRFYHIHPIGDDDLASYTNQKELPSETDFIADIQTRVIARKERPDVEILPERVVGVRGYSEFWTSEEALKIPKIDELTDQSLGDLNWTIGIRHMTTTFKFANVPPATFDEVVADLNNQGLKIEYRRLRDMPESLKVKE